MSNAVVSIYKLDSENVYADFERRKIRNARKLTVSGIVDVIMSPENKLELPYNDQLEAVPTVLDKKALLEEAKRYALGLKTKDLDVEIKLYKGRIETKDKWSLFFDQLAKNAEKRLEKNVQNSFLLFVLIDESIFVISSGLSYHQVSRYLDEHFGVVVVSHLIDTSNRGYPQR
ncbi:MAG: hypothetical protein JST04_04010 [Bdellovibrionales bacterium]|nr:hypothetical protein [Bdellovibrionales bacterium]